MAAAVLGKIQWRKGRSTVTGQASKDDAELLVLRQGWL
jgi:hypothetical protein